MTANTYMVCVSCPLSLSELWEVGSTIAACPPAPIISAPRTPFNSPLKDRFLWLSTKEVSVELWLINQALKMHLYTLLLFLKLLPKDVIVTYHLCLTDILISTPTGTHILCVYACMYVYIYIYRCVVNLTYCLTRQNLVMMHKVV